VDKIAGSTSKTTLETMKGVDFVTAAAIIAEVGDVKRFANANKLAKFAGCSPVSNSSGDTERNVRNKYGNRKLYYIFQGIAARNISAGYRRWRQKSLEDTK
jgi:transposase